METARRHGSGDIVLLHCTSGYPTPAEEANLLTLQDLARPFGAVGGLSDHTLGPEVPVAAVGIGAHALETHLTLRRPAAGPDAAFLPAPPESKQLSDGRRIARQGTGQNGKA